MADTKISALSAASAAALANELVINEAGTSKKLTLEQVRRLLGLGPNNRSVVAQSPPAATLTYLTGSVIAVPSIGVLVGSTFRWRMNFTKTAAGTALKQIIVKAGTNGTTADTSILTFTIPAGTGVVDTGYIEVEVTIQGPLGAACIAQGNLWYTHSLATTGIANKQGDILQATSAGFNSAAAGLKLGLVLNAGAAEAWTVPQIFAESQNL